jgi:hypothetical protein
LIVQAHAGVLRRQLPLSHANLSGMLPHRPHAFDAEFAPEFAMNFPHRDAMAEAAPAEHHCQICPTCYHRLTSHRCKLVCVQCGYYLSCADYY